MTGEFFFYFFSLLQEWKERVNRQVWDMLWFNSVFSDFATGAVLVELGIDFVDAELQVGREGIRCR